MSPEAKFHYAVLGTIIVLINIVLVVFIKQGEERRQKLFHFLLGLMSFGTFLLIFVGAMTASTRSGMAFMDWPTSNGLIWPSLDKWIHQKDMFWEHSHRLTAEGVGILAICLFSCSFSVHGKKYWKHSLILLLAIIIQGIFGGLTVGKLTAWWTSTLHGVVAQVVFAYMLILFYKTGKALKNHTPVEDNDSWLRSMPKMVCIIVLVQLFLGASFRHKMKVAQFSSEIPVKQETAFKFKKSGTYTIKVKTDVSGLFAAEFLSENSVTIDKEVSSGSNGELINIGDVEVKEGSSFNLKFSAAVSEIRLVGPERILASDKELPFSIVYKEVLKGNQHLLWAHIGFAVVVFVAVLLLGLYLLKKAENFNVLKGISFGIMISLLIQITLGVIAYLTVHERQKGVYDQLKTILTSAHLANGALLLAFCAVAMYFCRAGFVKTVNGE